MKIILTILISMISLITPAQTYRQLWQKVDEAAKNDLPKTQLSAIKQIAAKAMKEKAYGQLLKAQLKEGAVLASISPDSLKPALHRMEQTYNRLSDPTVKAVYATAIGKLYQRNKSTLDNSEADDEEEVDEEDEEEDAAVSTVDASKLSDKAHTWFDKAMADPALLASHKCEGYEPAMLKGNNDDLFNNDLLHVIGLETRRYDVLKDFYTRQGNRAAACYAHALALQERQGNGLLMDVGEIDSLLKVYEDLPVACELAILRLDAMIHATAGQKVAFINKALDKWGSWSRANSLRQSLQSLEQPSYSLALQRIALPNKNLTINIRAIRNIGTLTVNIYKVNVDGNTHLNPSVSKDYAQLKKLTASTPVATCSADYSGKDPWETLTDSLSVKGLPVGVYLVEAKTDNSRIAPSRELLRVSNVFVIHEALPNNKIRFAVVNATTGAHDRPERRGRLRLQAVQPQTHLCLDS